MALEPGTSSADNEVDVSRFADAGGDPSSLFFFSFGFLIDDSGSSKL